MTITRQRYSVDAVNTTDSGGINVRYWLPPVEAMGASSPLVIFCHQLGANEQISASYWAFPLVHAAVQEGWKVAASRAHGDNWGNDASLTDTINLRTLINGVHPVSDVILLGVSMGAVDAALTVAKGNLPAGAVKGVYLIDGVLDLNWAYGQAAFTASMNTAYSVSAFASIPAGHDPIRSYSASAYTGIRWRGTTSTADVTVTPASNWGAFAPIIAAAPEASTFTHNKTAHTSTAPAADFVAFAKRCGLASAA